MKKLASQGHEGGHHRTMVPQKKGSRPFGSPWLASELSTYHSTYVFHQVYPITTAGHSSGDQIHKATDTLAD